MNSSASPAAGPSPHIRRSWRPLLLTDPRRRFRRYFGRATVFLLAIGLVAGLLYVVLPPLFHPHTHVVLLTGADYQTPVAPSLEFAAEDAAGFEALRPALYALEGEQPPLAVPALTRPEALPAWGEACRRLSVGERDALLVYAAAHGVCGDGTPQLMCGSYDPAKPAAGVCSVSELLRPLAASGARVKLLILDAGRLGTDPLAGSVVNEFPRLLQREVLATGDRRLWVLSAAASLQRSHVSTALQRSVFGYLVTLGLSGAADANQDETVDLAELHRFVSANADAWVREQSDGQVRQTPLLLNGAGRTVDREPPVLISISALPKPSSSPSVSELRQLHRSQPFVRIQPAVSPDSLIRPPTPLAQPSSLLPPSLSRHVSVAPAPAPSASSVGQAVAGAAGGARSEPATGPAPTAKPAAGVPATQEKPSAEGPVPAEGGEGGSQPPPPQAPLLLVEAWQLRDALEDRRLPSPRPADFAPELWREFQRQLLSYERQVRAGLASNDGQIAAALRKTILPLAEWLPAAAPASVNAASRTADGIALRIVQRQPPRGFAIQQPRSVGLAELAVGPDLAALPETLRKHVQQYDELAERGQREAFDKWLAELPPEFDQFIEFRTARRLGGLSGVAWETIQDAIRVRRLAERISAGNVGMSAWIAPQVERGDRALWGAERGLLDQIGSDFASRARQELRKAEEAYRAAEADAAVIEAATQLSNELAVRAFFYVDFCRQSALVRDGGGPAPEDVKKLVGLLSRLDKLLRLHSPDGLPDVRQTYQGAQWLRESVERGLQEAHVKRLLQPNPIAGDAQRIETLLSTPLLAADLRVRLLRAAADVDVELTSAFDWILDPGAAILPPKLDREDWVPSLQAADLAYALATLAAPDDWEGAPALKDLNETHEKLLGTSGPGADVPAEQRFAVHREFGNALRGFFAALPERMAATLARDGDVSREASRRRRLETLRATLQAGRLTLIWDGRPSAAADVQAKLRQADGYDLLMWQRQRFLQAVSDAPAEDLAYLTDAAGHYRQQAATVPGQPPPQPDLTPRLEIDGPSALALTTSDQEEFEVGFRYAGSVPAPARVVFKYDPELIELRTLDEGVRFYRDDVPDHSGQTGERPSFVFPNGGQQTLRLAARRVGPSLRPTQLVIKARTGSVYVRRRIEIQLPAPAPIELAAGGIPNSWTATSDGVLLHPFPNRATDFQLSLVNRSGQPKSVDVQVRAAHARIEHPLPLAAMTPAEADHLLQRLSATEVLIAAAELALPAVEAPVPIEFPKPEEAPPPKPAAKEPVDGDAMNPATKTTAGVQELLLVITDRQTQQRTIRRIQVEPQRPRRFLQARVGYNLSRQRVEIRVAASDRAVLPPGELKVRAEFVEPLGAAAERRLDGQLRAPDYAAELYAEVESAPQRIATVQLHVDGYPRAFIFRVPCGSHSVELPEERDRLDVRITELPNGRNYLPGDSVPARLQIDAPQGAFDRPDDVVEIGADVDRDRELEGEQVLSLRADRQASVRVTRFAPGGGMTLFADVDDYLVTLPPVGLQNAPANVIARIIVGTRQGWSNAEPVVFDALPPRATRIELDPDRAVLHGADLTVLSWVTDDDLSGIAKVEAGLDIQRSGQLATEPKPAAAYQDAAGRWVAKLATGDYPPGQYTLLVRMTDNLNNSRLVKVQDIRLLTEQEAKEEQKKLANPVTGAVFFGSQAVPGAMVELAAAEQKPEADAAAKKPNGDAAAEAEPPTVIAPVRMPTDEQGRFKFPKVAPGDYRISAKVLLHNKIRQAAQDISVPTPPQRLEPLRLEL